MSFYPKSSQKLLIAVTSMLRDIRYPIILPNGNVADRVVPVRLGTGQTLVKELKKPQGTTKHKYDIPIPIMGISPIFSGSAGQYA